MAQFWSVSEAELHSTFESALVLFPSQRLGSSATKSYSCLSPSWLGSPAVYFAPDSDPLGFLKVLAPLPTAL